MEFKVGDWVYCEFELQQIVAMDGPRVQEVTTGLMRHSSFDLADRCVPLTLPMKRVSDEYEFYSKRIHREGSCGLNYPDIHRWLVAHWREACNHTEDSAWIQANYKALNQFSQDVLRKQEVDSGYGFALIRTKSA